MNQLMGSLDGYKVYVLAALALLHAAGSWLVGDMALQEAIDQAWTAGVAAAFRHAVSKVN